MTGGWGGQPAPPVSEENGKPRPPTVGHSSHSCVHTAVAELPLTVGEALRGTNIQQG